jgi:nitrate/nitrite-specific signal transduction histidine kinase
MVATKKNNLKLAVAGTGLIFMTIFTLFILVRRFVINPLKKLEKMTDEISQGNLAARVDIGTADELEKLGHRFNTMAESLSRGRNHWKKGSCRPPKSYQMPTGSCKRWIG